MPNSLRLFLLFTKQNLDVESLLYHLQQIPSLARLQCIRDVESKKRNAQQLFKRGLAFLHIS
jgi:hypothetical protein